MSKKYSATTGGFYDTKTHGSNIPGDAIDITDQEYSDLILDPPENTFLSKDGNGYPIRVEIPAKTNVQLMAEEIAALTTKYKSDLQALQLNWLSVVVADGANEEAKKTVIAQDIADLKTKYLSDIAAVKVTYGG